MDNGWIMRKWNFPCFHEVIELHSRPCGSGGKARSQVMERLVGHILLFGGCVLGQNTQPQISPSGQRCGWQQPPTNVSTSE